MAYCMMCGNELPEEGCSFCPECGATVGAQVDAAAEANDVRSGEDASGATATGARGVADGAMSPAVSCLVADGAEVDGAEAAADFGDTAAARSGRSRWAVPMVAGALLGVALGGALLVFGPGARGAAGDGEVAIPELAGMPQQEAATELARVHLKVGKVTVTGCDEHAEGQVCEVSPAAGEKVATGSAIDLVVSSGKAGSAGTSEDTGGQASKDEGASKVDPAKKKGCILPDSSERLYTEDEVSMLSDWELVVARNEIFARHGRGFKDVKLQEHFDKRDWYVKQYSPKEFDALSPSPLSKTERANVEMLMGVEESRKSADADGQQASGVSDTFVEDVRKALGIPDGLDGVSYSQISSYWWEGGGMTVYSISFYRNGETIASASCKADGTPVRDILSYNGK